MVKALLFDVFGTVVDWRTGIAREVDTFFARRDQEVDGNAFALSWRQKYQPAMERIRSGARAYTRLDILHRENLDATLDEFGLAGDVGEADRVALTRAWERLPPWPDSVPGLTALKSRYPIAPCSNGSIALMTWLAKHAGLPWDVVLGAEIAQDYKPQPIVYQASCAALGLEPADVMMVAAHNSDLAAARAVGLKTAFIKRAREYGPDQTTDLEPTEAWDVADDDIIDLANILLEE